MKTYNITIENKAGQIVSDFLVTSENIQQARHLGQRNREKKGKLFAKVLR